MRKEGGNNQKYNPAIHHRHSIRLKGYDYSRPGAYFVTICVQEKDRPLFGDVIDGKMQLSHMGKIVWKCWNQLPRHYPNIKLDEFVVMPNHVHGIIWIIGPDEKEAGAGDNGDHEGAGEYGNHEGAGLQNSYAKDAKPARTTRDAHDAHDSHDSRDAQEIQEIDIIHMGQGVNVNGFKEPKPIVIYPLSEVIRGFKTFSARRINELRGVAGVPVWQRNYWERILWNEEALQRVREYIVNNPAKWEKR